MLKNLKFPLIYFDEVMFWLPLMAGFFITSVFLMSEPLSSMDLQGKALPSSWEAAISNHGNFFEGYLIANHPLAFAGGLILLLASAALLYPVHKAQRHQHQAASSNEKRFHTIAQLIVGAVLIGIG